MTDATHAPRTSPARIILGFAAGQRGRMSASITLAVVSVAAGLVPFFAVAQLLTDVLAGSATWGRVLAWAGIAASGQIVRVVAYGAATVVSHRAAYDILAEIRARLTGKLARSPMGYVGSVPSGRFTQLIVDDVERLEYPLAHAIPEVISNLLAPLAIGVYLFVLDWRLGLAALVTLPLGFAVYALMMAGRGAMYREYVEATGRLNAEAVEYVAGIQVVKMFGRSEESLRGFGVTVARVRDLALAWYRHCWPYLSVFQVLTPASIALALPLGAWFYAGGSLSLYALIAAVVLSLGLMSPVMKLVEFSENLAVIDETGGKVAAALAVPELPEPERFAVLDGHTVTVRDVGFGYADDTAVLRGISFTAAPGTTTALVGPSGAGKSTIARLLVRFWDVDEGAIEIGGVDVRAMPLAQLTSQVAYVGQENFLFDTDIAENIRIGRPGASDDEVIAAAERAGCAEFAERLPEGYRTRVGDGGERLSGGERQRVAIGRAFLKDAPVVVLDEATAFTDPASEDAIQRSLSALARGRCLIVIAHRLATIRHADQILVIDDGRVVARGTHEQLLADSGLYRSMWEQGERAMTEGVRAVAEGNPS